MIFHDISCNDFYKELIIMFDLGLVCQREIFLRALNYSVFNFYNISAHIQSINKPSLNLSIRIFLLVIINCI